MTSYIYALADSKGAIRYVGATTQNPIRRLSEHLHNVKRGSTTPVSQWIRKIKSKPLLFILQVDPKNLDKAERRWTTKLKAQSVNKPAKPILNRTVGGRKGWHWSDADKAKHSAKMKGRKHTPEHNAKISASSKGHKKPPGFGARVAERNSTRVLSPETLEKMRTSHLGQFRSKATSRKQAASLKKTWARRKRLGLVKPQKHSAQWCKQHSKDMKDYHARRKALKQS